MIDAKRILAAVSESVEAPSTFGSIWAALGKPDKRVLYGSLMTLSDTGHIWTTEGLFVRTGRAIASSPVAEMLWANGSKC